MGEGLLLCFEIIKSKDKQGKDNIRKGRLGKNCPHCVLKLLQMSGERYFLETHIPGGELPGLRSKISENPQDESHLHVTLVRPFTIPDGTEGAVKQKIVKFCRGRRPIPFTLAGEGSFDEVRYVPVSSEQLLEFDTDLEKVLAGSVVFDPKLSEIKVLHMTVESDAEPLSDTEKVMLRLTCIRSAGHGKDKKIWFSFDFATQEVLNREDSLDNSRWQESQRLYNLGLC